MESKWKLMGWSAQKTQYTGQRQTQLTVVARIAEGLNCLDENEKDPLFRARSLFHFDGLLSTEEFSVLIHRLIFYFNSLNPHDKIANNRNRGDKIAQSSFQRTCANAQAL